MLATLLKAFKVKEIRDRILFVFGAFAIFVLTVHISVPGVNLKVWQELLKSGALFTFLGMFTGGALDNFSICAMGITPYINASIIMQLLTFAVPKLQELQKEGGDIGRRKISQYVRLMTIGLALLQATFMVVGLSRLKVPGGVFFFGGPVYALLVIFSLSAGTAFLMWLGEQMQDKGIGNGVSLLIFAGIVLRYPNYVLNTLRLTRATGGGSWANLLVFFAISIVLIMAIVMITQGQRKVPVSYAKRVVGRRVMGGQSTHIPIRVNNAGVISIIFAISIMYLPSTFTSFVHPEPGTFMFGLVDYIRNLFNPAGWFYNLFYALLVIFFTYFYSYIQFNIMDLSDNMKKYGGFIPGIRPGRPTAEYLERILSRLTFISGVFLAVIAVAPTYVMRFTNVTSFYLGSTSLLIVVGVALDTMQQIEARLVMRHYKGFMK